MRLKSVILCSTAIAFAAASPSYAQTPPAQEPPAEEPAPTGEVPPEEEGEIVVTGIRRSIESAQAVKRDSEAILDSIVAEDIGKLPDITASASLARVPGVQVLRRAGEADAVQIRGLPDISTTYNGRDIFTAEGRFVAVQDFPAGQVAALEVYKSSTANLIEGGIGGQINVRGRKPLDFEKGITAFGALNGVHFDQVQDFMVNGNMLLSGRWDTGIGEIGALVSVAYAETEFLDSTREAAPFIEFGVPVTGGPAGVYRRANSDARPQFNERTRPDVVRYPDSAALFYGRGDRYRPSVTAALQWKPTPDLEFYVDGLFQGYRAEDSNRFLFVPLFGAAQITNVVLQEDDPTRIQSATFSNQVRPDGFQSATKAKTDTYQIAGGVIWTPDRLRLSADIAYTDSTFTVSNTNIDYAFARAPVVDVDFDIERGAGGPVFGFRDFDTTDPANYIFRGLFDERLRASGKDIQARLDAQYETGFDFLPRIDAGVRFADREIERLRGDDFLGNADVEPRRIPLGSLVDLASVEPGFSFDNLQRLRVFLTPTYGSIRNNAQALRDLVNSFNRRQDFCRQPNTPLDQCPIEQREFVETFDNGGSLYEPLQTFTGDEKSYAGYLQAKYEFELGGDLVLDGLIGVRAIRTETTVNGTLRTVTPNPPGPAIITDEPISDSKTQTEWLPNVSARLNFGGGLQARAAYTQTRTLPNFGQLNPGSTINFNDPRFINVSGGNPDLEPLRSDNYDLSLEYYFSRRGSATVALFRRDVEGFIGNVQTIVNPVGEDPTAPDFVRGIRNNRPENGGEGRLQGVEVAFTTTFEFDWVPEWARNFGIVANYTYNDASSELPRGNAPPVDAGPPGGPTYEQDLGANRPGQQRLAGVSKHQYNIIGFYETPKFSARLAYNWRSDFVTFYRNAPNFPLFDGPPPDFADGPCCIEFDRPEIHEARGTLDLGLTVTPDPAITIAFDVGNILGNPIKLTNPYTADPDGPSFPLRRTYIERLYSLGVRFRF